MVFLQQNLKTNLDVYNFKLYVLSKYNSWPTNFYVQLFFVKRFNTLVIQSYVTHFYENVDNTFNSRNTDNHLLW